MEIWEQVLKDNGNKKSTKKEAWANVREQLSKYLVANYKFKEDELNKFFELDNLLKEKFGVFDKDDA